MYDINGLIYLMKPFRTTTDKITKNDIFISIVKMYPETRIKVEYCKDKGIKGDLYTLSDNIYRPGIRGLYLYNESTIEVIQKWQKGFNMIIDINNELIEMDMNDIIDIKKHIMGMKNLKNIKSEGVKKNDFHPRICTQN